MKFSLLIVVTLKIITNRHWIQFQFRVNLISIRESIQGVWDKFKIFSKRVISWMFIKNVKDYLETGKFFHENFLNWKSLDNQILSFIKLIKNL